IEALFPFGYGLSFAEFKIDNIHLDKESLDGKDDILTIEFDVANISDRPGSEIIQIYSSDSDCSVPRPKKELVSFEKVQLNPGDTLSIQLEVKAEDLAFYDVSQHDWNIEPGTFEIRIAKSSQDIVAKSSIHFN
ncbi:MAG: fibronectin type III-like domain-contianing protein, partial [Candidatus Thorarchaeota archaeon]